MDSSTQSSLPTNISATIVSLKQQPVRKKIFKYNLEALRGFAALIVVFAHCTGFSIVLNGVEQKGLWRYEFPGHIAVLIFFILSGYVIGLSTTENLTWKTTITYLKRRLVRLYPIYILAILIGLAITQKHYSAIDIISNLTFQQMAVAPPMYEVGMNWSLHYEVLFYLLFIPISIYQWKTIPIFLLSLVIAFFFQFIVPIQGLAMYGFGFCFWLAGLWLSQTKYIIPVVTSRYKLIGLLFLILSFGSLNFAQEILRYKLHTDNIQGQYHYNPTGIMFSDLTILPLGLLLVTYFTDYRLRYSSWLTVFVIATPLAYGLFQIKENWSHPVDFEAKAVTYFLYALAIIFLILARFRTVNVSKKLPQPMIALGNISYGIYLIHFIIIILLGRVSFLYGSAITFVGRTFLTVILTLLAAYILEKIWHPFAIRQLQRAGIIAK